MGAMSDMDRKIAMNAMPRQQSAAIMDMVGKTNGAISNREMEMYLAKTHVHLIKTRGFKEINLWRSYK
jgi:hypothetical protein